MIKLPQHYDQFDVARMCIQINKDIEYATTGENDGWLVDNVEMTEDLAIKLGASKTRARLHYVFNLGLLSSVDVLINPAAPLESYRLNLVRAYEQTQWRSTRDFSLFGEEGE